MAPQLVTFILISAGIAFALAIAVGSIAVRAGFPGPTSVNRTTTIDGLRGYLALGVMVHHFVIWVQVERLGGVWGPPAVAFFDQLGNAGVSMFFMVTGYLFYPRLVAGYRDTNWARMFIGRAFRILPLVIVTIAAVTLIVKMRGAVGRPELVPYLMWLTGFDEPRLLDFPGTARINAKVMWSLWHEWIFYLIILPVAARLRDLLPRPVPSWVIPILLIAACLVGQALTASRLFEMAPCFALGMIAFELQHVERVRRFLRRRDVAVLAAAGLIVGMNLVPSPTSAATVLFAVFFLSVACGNDFWGLLRLRGSRVLGDCSFSIYLWHGIVLSLLFVEGQAIVGWLPTPWLPAALPLAMAIVVIVSIASYLLVERPMIAAGMRVADRLDRTGSLRAHFRGRASLNNPA